MIKIRGIYQFIAICALLLSFPPPLHATMLYTTVGSGVSHRGASGAEVPFSNGFLSPVVEVGARIGRDEYTGFYVRFLLDPENTSQISSYYITGKWNYVYFSDILFIGISGGMHIESSVTQEDENTSTVSSEESQFLFTCAVHAGISVALMRYHFLVFEGFPSFSIGGSMQWSLNVTIGLMSMF